MDTLPTTASPVRSSAYDGDSTPIAPIRMVSHTPEVLDAIFEFRNGAASDKKTTEEVREASMPEGFRTKDD